MRITASQVSRAQLLEARRKQVDGAKAGQRASSGRRIDRPSDDPSGSRRALLVKAAIDDYAIGRKKIDRAATEHERREAALALMTTALSRAREVAVGMANGTTDAATRTAAAAEIDGIRQTLVNLGNTRFSGRFLFAGAQTDAPAFSAAGLYEGDTNPVQVELPTDITTTVTADGGALLRGTGGAQSVLGAVEGLQAGLLNNDITAIRTGLDELGASIDHVIDSRAALGASLSVIERLDEIFSTVEATLENERAGIETVDLVEAYSDVVRTRAAYEQAIRVMVSSRTPSIFELL
jgi:flagellar hook-associated protein 3 FlgL